MEMTKEEFNALKWPSYRALVFKNENPTTPEAVRLRTEIIEAYVYLAKLVVGKMKKSMPTHVEADDLESWAKIGLMQAVTRYDHTIKVPFEAFATQRMRSVIMDGIRDADWAPRSLRKKQRDITKLEEKFRQTHGRDPNTSEIAMLVVNEEVKDENLCWSVDEYNDRVADVMLEIADTKYQVDISSHTYIEGSLEAQNKPSSIDDDEDELIYLLKATLAKSLQEMSVRKAVIISLHYYHEKKLSDIAAVLKMSEVRVGVLHAEAVMEIWQRIKEVLNDETL